MNRHSSRRPTTNKGRKFESSSNENKSKQGLNRHTYDKPAYGKRASGEGGDKPFAHKRSSHSGSEGGNRRGYKKSVYDKNSDGQKQPALVRFNKNRKFADAKDAKNQRIAFSKKKSDIPLPTTTVDINKGIRLNRYISNSGICSRREADVHISQGVVMVNGQTVTEMGYIVQPGDVVKFDGKIIKPEKPIYLLLNKPKNFLTTTDDPEERNTVMELVKNACRERIYPVGRLDRNSTGLLLFTNDGELADKLTHPSHNVKKIYSVELDRPLEPQDANDILAGVLLEEGKAIVDSMAILDETRRNIGIEIHIGWNRVIRRIFESKGYVVQRLDRVMYAGLTKKDLKRGSYRFLTKEEVITLKHFI